MDHSSQQQIQKLLDVKQLAKRLGCSDRHITRLVASGKFPAPIKLGHLSRWDPKVVDQWLAEGGADLS